MQSTNILGWRRNICSFVATEFLINMLVVVSDGTWMYLHDKAVFDRHASHFGKHLSPKHFIVARLCAASKNPLIKTFGLRERQVGRKYSRMAMIGSGSTVCLEKSSA